MAQAAIGDSTQNQHRLRLYGGDRTERPGDAVLGPTGCCQGALDQRSCSLAQCLIDWQFTTRDARIKLKRLDSSIQLS